MRPGAQVFLGTRKFKLEAKEATNEDYLHCKHCLCTLVLICTIVHLYIVLFLEYFVLQKKLSSTGVRRHKPGGASDTDVQYATYTTWNEFCQ